MKITCWGSRGSIAVSGNEYSRFGGETTCIEITADSGETVIIDAGTGIRKLGLDLMNRSVQKIHLLLTHAHWDHVSGFAFFKPLQDPSVTLEIQNNRFAGTEIKTILEKLVKPPFFPITMKDLEARITFREDLKDGFSIGSLDISTIALSHPGGGLGYRFSENGRTFVFLTDNELAHAHPGCRDLADYKAFCQDADILVHDAEFTPEEYPAKKGWGHTSYTQAIDLALDADVRQLGLFHINQERTDDEMDRIVDHSRQLIKSRGSKMTCFGVACNMPLDFD